MSSGGSRKLEIEGTSPYKLPSGVFEVQIALCESPPTTEEIAKKSFSYVWKDNFHLRVKDKKFNQVLGSDNNQIPNSVFQRSSIWVVMVDQFSSIHTVFETEVSSPYSKKISESYESSKPADRKSTRLNSSHSRASRMPSSA